MKANEHYQTEFRTNNNPNQFTQQRNLYDQYQQHMEDQIIPHPKGNRVNLNSIAYLSSILQDEHQQNQRNTVAFESQQRPSISSVHQYQRYRSSTTKKSNRYLSCLLQAPETNERIEHSKTEEIQKKLQKRKIMPIDQLKQKRKNITFSLKNKLDLNKDFNQFVSKKIQAQIVQVPEQQHDKETIVFCKRKYTDKNFANIRAGTKKQKRRRIMEDIKAVEQNKQVPGSLSNKKMNIEGRQPGYAMAFKRLSSDIPRLERFEWSRLDDNSYQMIKG